MTEIRDPGLVEARSRVRHWRGSGQPPAPEIVGLGAYQRRMWLWVACNGKCSGCPAYITVENLTPVRDADGVWGAWCPGCKAKHERTVEGGNQPAR